MNYLLVVFQCVVAVSILNVWLIQSKKPTQWRGGDAKTIVEEFRVYGLPLWMCYAVGILKVLFALGLLLAIWYPEFRQVSALGLAVLLLGSIGMHLKIGDPLKKSVPALIILCMCLYIAFPLF